MKLVKTYRIPEWIGYLAEYVFEYPNGEDTYYTSDSYFGIGPSVMNTANFKFIVKAIKREQRHRRIWNAINKYILFWKS